MTRQFVPNEDESIDSCLRDFVAKIQKEIPRRVSQLQFDFTAFSFCYSSVITWQTLSINGSVAVSVLDLSLDKTEMNSRITCRAVNPYLDSTVMEDTWNVNLSCKSICPFFLLIIVCLFFSFVAIVARR
jgi:hypothetical protein